MIQINIGELILLLGIPSALTGFCFWLIERKIQKRDKKREQKEEEERKERERKDTENRKKDEERERSREKLELLIIQSNGAAVALAEATARAVQRIPDAHCNGDMHEALNYAAEAKHDLKNFLAEQGVSAIFN